MIRNCWEPSLMFVGEWLLLLYLYWFAASVRSESPLQSLRQLPNLHKTSVKLSWCLSSCSSLFQYFLLYGSWYPFTFSVLVKFHNAGALHMLVLTGMLVSREALLYICLDYFGKFCNKLRNCEIAIGMCQFVLASTCAYWYFSHLNRDDT